MATTIGKLIEQEVRRQGRSITAFADEICCTRTNVYDIFGRNKMDVAQLELISKVLGHNFFKDLAENPALADANNPEVERDLQNRRAVAQFFDVMPKVLRNLNIETNIVMPIMKNEFNNPLPDYGLTDYAIFFTIGERLLDRFNNESIACFMYRQRLQPEDILSTYGIIKFTTVGSLMLNWITRLSRNGETLFSISWIAVCLLLKSIINKSYGTE